MMDVTFRCDCCGRVVLNMMVPAGTELPEFKTLLGMDLCDGCHTAIISSPAVQQIIDERRKLKEA